MRRVLPGFLLWSLFQFAFLIIPQVVYAGCSDLPGGVAQTETDFGCIPNDPILFASKFYGIGLSLLGGISLLFIIFGAYRIMTSQGNPKQLQDGKSYIFYAIVGLLLAIFGYMFIQIILIDVLHVPGFS